MTQEEIVAQHLHIADKTARYWWIRRRGHLQWLGVDREELGGMAALAFAEAVANWDIEKSPGGLDGLGPYLVQQTRWRLGNAIDRLSNAGRAPEGYGRVSLHAEVDEDGSPLADLLGEEDADLAQVERRDLAQSMLRRLDPIDRACVHLVVGQGLTLLEASKQVGMGQERVRQRVYRGLAVARATPAIGASPGDRDRDDVVDLSWYIHDPAARTITGPFAYSHDAASSLGLDIRRLNGRSSWVADLLGWPGVTPIEAMLLDRLAERGPALVRDLLVVGGVARPRESVRRALGGLMDRGWVRVVGTARTHKRQGPDQAVYGATPTASADRGPVHRVEILRGSAIAHLAQAEGYRMIRGGQQP